MPYKNQKDRTEAVRRCRAKKLSSVIPVTPDVTPVTPVTPDVTIFVVVELNKQKGG